MKRLGPVAHGKAVGSRHILVTAGNSAVRTGDGVGVAAAKRGVGGVGLDQVAKTANDGTVDRQVRRAHDGVALPTSDEGVVRAGLNGVVHTAADKRNTCGDRIERAAANGG